MISEINKTTLFLKWLTIASYNKLAQCSAHAFYSRLCCIITDNKSMNQLKMTFTREGRSQDSNSQPQSREANVVTDQTPEVNRA